LNYRTPSTTTEQYSKGRAVGQQLRYDYLKYSCWAARLKNRDSCPVEPGNIASCVGKSKYLTNVISKLYGEGVTVELVELDELPTSLSDILKSYLQITELYFDGIDSLLLLLTEDPVTMGKVCSINDTDWDILREFIENFDPPQKGGVGLGSIDCDNYDQPSNALGRDSDDYAKCFDPTKGEVTSMVRGQDFSGGISAYNDDVFINLGLAFQDQYGMEYTIPMKNYVEILSNNYYWPKNVPLPILGSPLIEGIVAGVLYDKATPYAWSAEMRGNFPSTTLLTSQNIFHGISNDRGKGSIGPFGPCQKYITEYLKTGLIDWTDGTVCGQQFPYFSGEIRK
jgi:hypothetical protein